MPLRAVAVLAGLLVVLFIFGVACDGVGTGDSADVVERTESTVLATFDETLNGTASSAAVGETTTAAIALSDWLRVVDSAGALGGEGSQTMHDVTAGGPGLVAVGEDLDLSSFDFDAAVWASPDGVAWTRVLDPQGAFGGDGPQVMAAVTDGGPGLVAVGLAGLDGGVWTSPDAKDWMRVLDDEGVFANATISDVTLHGSVLVAVGHTGHIGEDNDAAVWTSSDGINWTRVPDNEDVFGGNGSQGMNRVTSGGTGLVAVGAADGDAAVWTSPDGMTWTRVRDTGGELGGEGDQWMNSVTRGGTGLVAVGTTAVDDDRSGAVWASPDGDSWTRVRDIGTLEEGKRITELRSVAAVEDVLVAVGSDISPDGDTRAPIWISPDGVTWSQVADGEPFTGSVIYRVISEGPSVLAVGSVAPNAAVWMPVTPQP